MVRESWVDDLLGSEHARHYLKASDYELGVDPMFGTKVLKAKGPLEEVDLTQAPVAEALASLARPRTLDTDCLRFAREFGLAGDWDGSQVVARNVPTDVPDIEGWTPPVQEEIRELLYVAQEVARGIEGYHHSLEAVWFDGADPEDPPVQEAYFDFESPITEAASLVFAGEVWQTTRLVWQPPDLESDGSPLGGFVWGRPPSLWTYALISVLAKAEDGIPVRECALDECGRVFYQGREDQIYHDRKCAQRAWYLKKH